MAEIPENRESILLNKAKEISEIIPAADDYLGMLLEELVQYEDSYRDNIETFLKFYGEDLKDMLDELKEFLSECPKGKSEDLKRLLKEIFDLLGDGFDLSKTLLIDFFSESGVDVETPVEEIPQLPGKPYKMANVEVNERDARQFAMDCGLVFESSGGKGDHGRLYDPEGEMTKPQTLDTGRIWLKTLVNGLVRNGLSVNRVAQACEKWKIWFEYRDQKLINKL